MGNDDQVRGAVICILSRERKTSILRQPVSQLYPFEIVCKSAPNLNVTPRATQPSETLDKELEIGRPRQAAAQRARDWMQAVLHAPR